MHSAGNSTANFSLGFHDSRNWTGVILLPKAKCTRLVLYQMSQSMSLALNSSGSSNKHFGRNTEGNPLYSSMIEKDTGADVYFARARHPWERGTEKTLSAEYVVSSQKDLILLVSPKKISIG